MLQSGVVIKGELKGCTVIEKSGGAFIFLIATVHWFYNYVFIPLKIPLFFVLILILPNSESLCVLSVQLVISKCDVMNPSNTIFVSVLPSSTRFSTSWRTVYPNS